MNEVTTRKRPIAVLLVKLLVVLLLPLDGRFRYYSTGWSSLILSVNFDPLEFYFSLSLVPLALIIMLPSMIFNYHLNLKPISAQLRGRALGAAILCWFLGSYFPSPIILPIEVYYPYAFQYAPVLGIFFFIILPLISREATMMRISAKDQRLGYSVIGSTLGKVIRREKVLSIILWSSLVFFPFISYWNPVFRFG